MPTRVTAASGAHRGPTGSALACLTGRTGRKGSFALRSMLGSTVSTSPQAPVSRTFSPSVRPSSRSRRASSCRCRPVEAASSVEASTRLPSSRGPSRTGAAFRFSARCTASTPPGPRRSWAESRERRTFAAPSARYGPRRSPVDPSSWWTTCSLPGPRSASAPMPFAARGRPASRRGPWAGRSGETYFCL